MELICLCASHIDCVERFRYFEDMLESWYNQSIRVPLVVSVSTEIPHAELLNHLAEKWYDKYNSPEADPVTKLAESDDEGSECESECESERTWLHLVIGPPANQMEHYKRAVSRLKGLLTSGDISEGALEDIWVMFTDDDDIWNTHRARTYEYGLEELAKVDHDVAFIRAGSTFMSNKDGAEHRGPDTVQTWWEDKMVLKQRVLNGVYVEYSCRLRDIDTFLTECGSSVLKSKFADKFICKFLRAKGIKGIEIESGDWLYYFRQWKGQACYQEDTIIKKYTELGIDIPCDEKGINFMVELQAFATFAYPEMLLSMPNPYKVFRKRFLLGVGSYGTRYKKLFKQLLETKGPIADMFNSPVIMGCEGDGDCEGEA